MVDLIPYNDIGFGFEGGANFARSRDESINRFQQEVRSAGFPCFVRITRGDDSAAACGQLATRTASPASKIKE